VPAAVVAAVLVAAPLGTRADVAKKAAAVEYKVVYVEPKPGSPMQAAEKMTKEFNALAEEGWEFVTRLTDRVASTWGANGQPTSHYAAGAFVLFKRPKP
jgi:hypothetical protein